MAIYELGEKSSSSSGVILPINITDVTNLQPEISRLDSRIDNAGSGGAALPINISDVTNLQTNLNSKAPTVHSHPIAEINGLQLELDNASNRIGEFTVGNGGQYPTLYDCLNAVHVNNSATNATNRAMYDGIVINLLSDVTEVGNLLCENSKTSIIIEGNDFTITSNFKVTFDNIGSVLRFDRVKFISISAEDNTYDLVRYKSSTKNTFMKIMRVSNFAINSSEIRSMYLTTLCCFKTTMTLTGVVTISADSYKRIAINLLQSYLSAESCVLYVNAGNIALFIQDNSFAASDENSKLYFHITSGSSDSSGILCGDSSMVEFISQVISITGTPKNGVNVTASSRVIIHRPDNSSLPYEFIIDSGAFDTTGSTGVLAGISSSCYIESPRINNFETPYYLEKGSRMTVWNGITDTNTQGPYSAQVAGGNGNYSDFYYSGEPLSKGIL